MADQIQIRRDTAASWTTANPTLAQGEFGYEHDTGKLKLGDGSTAWNSLGYYENPSSTAIPAPGSPAQGDILYYNGSNWVALNAGTSGYYLKTQGAGANPVWAEVAVGGDATITDCIVYSIALG